MSAADPAAAVPAAEPLPQPAPFLLEALPTEVLLIRHGQSAAYVPGDADSHDPPLSVLGRRQVAVLAARLAGRRIDAVVASDLVRAVETARPLAEDRDLEMVTRQDLREVDVGDWAGGEFRVRAAARDPEFLAFARAGRWDAIPGAEPDNDLRERVFAAVSGIAAAHPGGSVAVVCHTGVINAVLARWVDAERSILAVIENTSVTTLRTDGQQWLVVGVNDCHHLGDPLLAVP
ncbi:MAG: histidine phosphatase family protein [Acidimicrobiales bacterium]